MAYWTPEQRAKRRAKHDAIVAERHRNFDLFAQDNHMKSERSHFAIVGEGTRSAQEAYRANWSLIDWSQ